MAENYENKVICRENWLNRYDTILDQIQKLPLNADAQELISGYDNICALIDRLCLEIIDELPITMN